MAVSQLGIKSVVLAHLFRFLSRLATRVILFFFLSLSKVQFELIFTIKRQSVVSVRWKNVSYVKKTTIESA
jgi:hypothetical protein